MKSSTVFLVFLGLCVAGIGLLFTALMWDSFQRAQKMHAWPQVEAVILSSGIKERRHDEFSAKEYQLEILYGYEWEGEAKTGERFSARGNPWSKDRAKPEKDLKRYPEGGRTRVFVKPDDPDYAVLKPDSKAAGYSIWFPLLFVVGGLGIVVRSLWPRRQAAG